MLGSCSGAKEISCYNLQVQTMNTESDPMKREYSKHYRNTDGVRRQQLRLVRCECEVFTTTIMKMAVFWDTERCSFVEIDRRVK